MTLLRYDGMTTLRKGILLVALLITLPLSAKKVQPKEGAALSVEQEQQFSYYWFAAKQAIDQERYADAYALLEFCRSLKPNDGQTLTFLGIIYDGLGQKEMAISAFRQAYEADPNGQWQRHLEWLVEHYVTEKQWAEAIQTLDEIDKRKNDYDAKSAWMHFRIYAAWGKPNKAVAAIDKYLKIDPNNLQFLLLKAELLEQNERAPVQPLYKLYDRILELDPSNIMILNNYAYLLAQNKGNLQKAEKMSAITIREEPNNAVYLDTYGWIMHLQGQKELAVFYLQRALQNAPKTSVKQIIEQHLEKARK